MEGKWRVKNTWELQPQQIRKLENPILRSTSTYRRKRRKHLKKEAPSERQRFLFKFFRLFVIPGIFNFQRLRLTGRRKKHDGLGERPSWMWMKRFIVHSLPLLASWNTRIGDPLNMCWNASSVGSCFLVPKTSCVFSMTFPHLSKLVGTCWEPKTQLIEDEVWWFFLNSWGFQQFSWRAWLNVWLSMHVVDLSSCLEVLEVLDVIPRTNSQLELTFNLWLHIF